MKKIVKGIFVVIATLSVVASMALTAAVEVKVDGQKHPLYDEEAVLTKVIKIPEGVIVPNLVFDFDAVPLGEEDEEGNLFGTAPEWKLPSIEFSEDSVNPDKGESGNKAVKTTDNLLVKKVINETTILQLKDASADDATVNFGHAGVYLYEVTEKVPNPSDPEDVITRYSQAKYTVRVYVENIEDKDGNSLLTVKGLTILKVTDDNGDNVGAKVDPTPGSDTEYGGSEFRFVNEFWDETELEVEKRVAGNAGDRTKAFDFDISLTLPTVVAAPDDHKITYTLSGDPTNTVFEYDGNNPISVKLKHGEKIIFKNLPVGSTYNVVETIAKGYTPSAVVTGRGTNGVATDGTPDDDLKFTVMVGDVIDLLVDFEQDGIENTTVVTNEYKDPSITGVLTDNFPFIVMVLVAGAGIVFLTVSKRRRAQ